MYKNKQERANTSNVETSETPVQIKIATTKGEKEDIYRFRYQVFVEEMSTPLHAADHTNKMIVDEIDKRSILLYAQVDSKIVGTARMTIGDINQFPGWISETFKFAHFKKMLKGYTNQKIGLSTKIAISPEYRGSTVMYRLISDIFRIYNDHRIQFTFSGGNPRMIQLYERVGYRRFTENFTEPGYGLLIPLVFIHDDIDHLKLVRSPLYRIAPKTKKSLLSNKFYQAFPDANKYINSQLIIKNPSMLETIFDPTIKYALPLGDFNKKEIFTLIQLGAIFPCTKGDIIATQGEMSNELYFLLSGSLSSTSSFGVNSLIPGDCFGHGLTGPKPYSEQIIAVSESSLLIVSNLAFGKFKHLHPDAAVRLENFLRMGE